MQEVYTERNSEISPALKFPAVDEIPYIMDLREWANKRVRDYEKNHPKLPPIKTYKIPGSNGMTYTIRISEKMISCSCPGFTYRRRCKHIEKTPMEELIG
jgi:hypothetical protein